MDFTTVSETVLLRSQPSSSSPPVELPGGFTVRVYRGDMLINRADQPDGWSLVTIDSGGSSGPTGYLKTSYLITKKTKPQDITYVDFTRVVAVAAIAFNVDVAYLLALARLESGQAWDDQRAVIDASIYRDQ